ncbi:hypothetical protein [Cognatishimia sp. MH4019]|nr:hypothetical protein [Cognatishimia sp. MH4019]
MTGQRKTLLLIGVFVALMIGSFIWFVVTWDPSKEEPVSHLTSSEAFA